MDFSLLKFETTIKIKQKRYSFFLQYVIDLSFVSSTPSTIDYKASKFYSTCTTFHYYTSFCVKSGIAIEYVPLTLFLHTHIHTHNFLFFTYNVATDECSSPILTLSERGRRGNTGS